ncbi:ImmA/IrrE family metallo-endopeptidase [Curtobacterium flaccumfaciens]|uniref:ImmA/IrrE family metallo-endopeptidase n=1 Tax=Curtobacterium flaccumfaciens TaxID=2035 RepID=UPI001ADCA59D|nr:ImmA/IrrE family metallo-endopeptidase [Curtobacterium flaccumfaciens]MBO9049527.1 ImmA/IrrE family metallo-endopeptidase [Curtobacterium flaccumfaciens pv. flaccumfaciens]
MISRARSRHIQRTAIEEHFHGLRRGLAFDVFAAIEQHGVQLVFAPLQRLYGAYVPGERPGIMISSSHPQALQRYTAAHELGHHLLHREEYSLDGKAEIASGSGSGSGSDSEREAQLFAGQLLMPPFTVAAAMRQVGARNNGGITAPHVYEMSGLLGVSYSAMVHTLAGLHHINRSEQARLLAVRPKIIKADLAFGTNPARTAHVWAVRGPDAVDLSATTVGDEVAVELPENRTTGHRWFARTDGDAVEPSFDRYVSGRSSGEEVRIGAGGRRQLIIAINEPGSWSVRLAYSPAHRRDRPIEQIELTGTSRVPAGIDHANSYVRRFLEAEQRGDQ